jgi:hypothetical protein
VPLVSGLYWTDRIAVKNPEFLSNPCREFSSTTRHSGGVSIGGVVTLEKVGSWSLLSLRSKFRDGLCYSDEIQWEHVKGDLCSCGRIRGDQMTDHHRIFGTRRTFSMELAFSFLF